MEKVFDAASSVQSIVMTSDDMDKKELEELIALVEEEMDLNLVEFIQVGNVEYMIQLQKAMDGCYKNCVQKFRFWQDEYATVLDTTVEATLKGKVTKLKQDLLDYKRSALAKQASLPAAVVSQPSSVVGQGAAGYVPEARGQG